MDFQNIEYVTEISQFQISFILNRKRIDHGEGGDGEGATILDNGERREYAVCVTTLKHKSYNFERC